MLLPLEHNIHLFELIDGFPVVTQCMVNKIKMQLVRIFLPLSLPRCNDPWHFVFELFWKNSSYISSESVCIFVALSVWMCVAGANKVGGTMSWCLGTNESLASKYDFAALKVKQGHFETAFLVLYNFAAFYYG